MCSFPDLVILERSLTVAAQCFGAAIHDALHMIYTRRVISNENADLATDFATGNHSIDRDFSRPFLVAR